MQPVSLSQPHSWGSEALHKGILVCEQSLIHISVKELELGTFHSAIFLMSPHAYLFLNAIGETCILLVLDCFSPFSCDIWRIYTTFVSYHLIVHSFQKRQAQSNTPCISINLKAKSSQRKKDPGQDEYLCIRGKGPSATRAPPNLNPLFWQWRGEGLQEGSKIGHNRKRPSHSFLCIPRLELITRTNLLKYQLLCYGLYICYLT